MPIKTPQDVRERQLKELAEVDGYTFVGWNGAYNGNNSRSIFSCVEHGNWETRLTHFANMGTRCPKCSVQRRRSDLGDVRIKVLAACSKHNYEFVDFVGTYTNHNKSKVTLRCHSHGGFDVSVVHLTRNGSGCPTCGGTSKVPEQIAIAKINERGESKGYTFGSWVLDYKNNRSKANLVCEAHGTWVTTVDSILNQGTACPNCAEFGFSPSKVGTLYALLSSDKCMIKVGISNKFEQRLVQLRKRTPFEFEVLRELKFANGGDAIAAERIIHKAFPSAELTDFDGATEWLKWTPDVVTWIDLFSGGACNDQ